MSTDKSHHSLVPEQLGNRNNRTNSDWILI
jgi:hypothetical protein